MGLYISKKEACNSCMEEQRRKECAKGLLSARKAIAESQIDHMIRDDLLLLLHESADLLVMKVNKTLSSEPIP